MAKRKELKLIDKILKKAEFEFDADYIGLEFEETIKGKKIYFYAYAYYQDADKKWRDLAMSIDDKTIEFSVNEQEVIYEKLIKKGLDYNDGKNR